MGWHRNNGDRALNHWIPGWRAGLTTVLLLAAGACAPFPGLGGGQGRDLAAGFPVGLNLAGESCRITPNAQLVSSLQATQAFEVECGRWENASARIAVYDFDKVDAGRPAVWLSSIGAFAECPGEPQAQLQQMKAGRPLDCRLELGGFPYRALMSSTGGLAYAVDGIPSALGAAQRAVDVLSGVLPVEEAAGMQAGERDLAALGPEIGARVFTLGDVFGFRDHLRYAQYFNYQGNHAQAAAQYREALELHRRILPEDDVRRGIVLMHLALELSNQERFARADEVFNEAEKLVAVSLDPTDLAQLISYRALHQANQQNYEEALRLAEDASNRRRSVTSVFRDAASTDLIQSIYIEAAMLSRLERPDMALERLDEANRQVMVNPQIPGSWQARIHVLYADISEQEGDLKTALSYLNRAIESEARQSFESKLRATALLDKGRILLSQGEVERGFQSSREGMDMLERMNETVPGDKVAPLLKALSSRGVSGPHVADAFKYAQFARAPVIAQTMGLALARVALGDEEAARLIRDLQDLKQERDNAIAQLAQAQNQASAIAGQQAAIVQARLDDIGEQIAETERSVQSALPRYNLLLNEPVAMGDVQSTLGPDEGLVMFRTAPEGVLAFVVTANRGRLYDLPLTEDELRTRIAALRAPIDAATDYLDPYDVSEAHDLFAALFGRFDSEIAGLSSLVIVPSGPLLSLPFPMLVTRPASIPDDANYSTIPWLVKRHAVTVVPSVQGFHFARAKAKPSQATLSFAGLGATNPTAFETSGLMRNLEMPEQCETDINLLADLVPLQAAGEEIRQISSLVGQDSARLFDLENLSETDVKNLDFSEFRVVHFATHGLLPGTLACWPEPALVLGNVDDANPQDDGLLSASEIIDLEFDAELVILSACNTAFDKEFGGENLDSLSRAFFYAGARNIVVSHWAISDDATRELMVSLFSELKRGVSLSEALQRSQQALMLNTSTSHPYFWSAFSFIGDAATSVQL